MDYGFVFDCCEDEEWCFDDEGVFGVDFVYVFRE